MARRDPEIDDALATLARGLQGTIEVLVHSGIEALPRPQFAAITRAPVRPAANMEPARSSAAPEGELVRPAPIPAASAVSAPPPTKGLAVVDADARAQTHAAIAALLADHASAEDKMARLERDVIGACVRCKLHRGRNRLVFGAGNPSAELVFVGEGPGADEDRQGLPFVGKAGELLTRMIEAMGRKRSDVYICNVVKCRPPNNRDPEPDEVAACEGFLKAQLAIVRPRVIVCLGRHAAQTLLRSKTPITRMRGTWHHYEGIDVMPTYHPSFLLREEADPAKTRKREAWDDLKQVMAKLKPDD